MFGRKKDDKEALDAAVRAAGRLATELTAVTPVTEDLAFPSTATHFGGTPYFTPEETWPRLEEDGRPYDFVCQVNLKECPVRPNVTFDLFSVYLCWALLDEVDVDRACIVRSYDNATSANAVHVSRPSPVDANDYRVRPCTVHLKECVTYPSWSMHEFSEIAAAAGRFRDPEAAFQASLGRIGFWHDFRSRVGGFPTWVHDNTLLDKEDTVFLAQIDYHPEANNCIGDAAPTYLAVTSTEPQKVVTDVFQSF